MSQFSINQYFSKVENIIHYGGTNKETAIRNAFYDLLNEYAKPKGLLIVTEVTIKAANGKNITPDATLKDTLRQDWGYVESKDIADKIDDAIKKKFDKGYPKANILFENSQTAVLFQNGYEQMRVLMNDPEELEKIITTFIKFERPEVQNFRNAIEHFKEDVPKVTETLRTIIIEQEKKNSKFNIAGKKFLMLCHDSINPNVTMDDVREMIIQHILTEDIFNSVFGESQFHRENNIAHELEQVIDTFFTGNLRRAALSTIKHYYEAINAAAAGIADHHEKQKFLKVVYETFYRSYNPKAADRLGVVYTPNEIVRFMVQSTDYLLNKHFNKLLQDKGVEILDPATGTGTFICDIIDYIRKDRLEYKYSEEIHANEVAILPYYISNLNIEFTYKQKTGKYKQFESLCFADTLDNILGLNDSITGMDSKYKKTGDLFAMSTENKDRITRQNSKKISVVIGNPPYNANQMNENDNNKNREYPFIDKRIKDTFIKYSTAQKTKVYDMYARFYRWAMDRIDDRGIICFITNNSFINKRTFDGFRKVVQDEFQYAYIIDLGGDITELSGKDGIFLNEKNTIFGKAAAVGIAMMFLIKDKINSTKKCVINYIHPTDIRATRDEKLAYLAEHTFKEIPFEHIQPDKNNNWINLTDNDWEEHYSIKDIFSLCSNGVATGRDEWVYDLNESNLENKINFFLEKYNVNLNEKDYDLTIKWTETLKTYHKRKQTIEYNKNKIVISDYRPFFKQNYYSEKGLSDRLTANHYRINNQDLNDDNLSIVFTGTSSQRPFLVLVTKNIADWHYVGSASSSVCLPFFQYDKEGNKIENITQKSLNKFIEHYKTKKITKKDIFHYCYAVLHSPDYRTKYELNLKREFPRILFYEDFNKWAAWGSALMELHINYETVTPYPLKEISKNTVEHPKAKLKAIKTASTIEIDENTLLTQIPPAAWEYKLGNRSALEWVLDQYKESKPTDPTIAEKFNTYRFADYKEQVIDLLKRVCTVSVETMKIINEMKE